MAQLGEGGGEAQPRSPPTTQPHWSPNVGKPHCPTSRPNPHSLFSPHHHTWKGSSGKLVCSRAQSRLCSLMLSVAAWMGPCTYTCAGLCLLSLCHGDRIHSLPDVASGGLDETQSAHQEHTKSTPRATASLELVSSLETRPFSSMHHDCRLCSLPPTEHPSPAPCSHFPHTTHPPHTFAHTAYLEMVAAVHHQRP